MLGLTHQGLWLDCNKTRNITAQNSPLAVTGSLILVIYLRKCGEPKSYDIPARLQPSTKSGGTFGQLETRTSIGFIPASAIVYIVEITQSPIFGLFHHFA